MRRFVLFLSALIAIASAGLLVAARRSHTVQAVISRLADPDWTGRIALDRSEVGEVVA